MEKDWKLYLKCKECWDFKEINNDNRYKHSAWFMGVLWRCKECIKKWRSSERERVMARKCDNNRYHNNTNRKKCIFESASRRRKERWLQWLHSKTEYAIKKLWISISKCSICWKTHNRIVAHHPDYSKRYEIVFVCPICHSNIHLWKIQCPTPIKILKGKKTKWAKTHL